MLVICLKNYYSDCYADNIICKEKYRKTEALSLVVSDPRSLFNFTFYKLGFKKAAHIRLKRS